MDVPRGCRRRTHQVTARHRRCLAVLVQRQYERDSVGRQVRCPHALDRLCGTPVELRVRDGSTHIFSGAANRRAIGNSFLLLPGPRLHQAGGFREDPRRDDRALPRKTWCRHHRREESSSAAGVSLAWLKAGVSDAELLLTDLSITNMIKRW